MLSNDESEHFNFKKRFYDLMSNFRAQVLADVNRAFNLQTNLIYDLLLKSMEKQKELIFTQLDEVLKEQKEAFKDLEKFDLSSSPATCIQSSSASQQKVHIAQPSTSKEPLQPNLSSLSLKRILPNDFAQPSSSKQQCIDLPFVNSQPSSSKQAAFQIHKVPNTNSSTQPNADHITAKVQQKLLKAPHQSSVTTSLAKIVLSGNPNQVIYVKKDSLPPSLQTSKVSRAIIVVPKTSSVTTQPFRLPDNTQSNTITQTPAKSQRSQPTLSTKSLESNSKNKGSEIIVASCSKQVENQLALTQEQCSPAFVEHSNQIKVPKHLSFDTTCSCDDCYRHEYLDEDENEEATGDSEDDVRFVNELKRIPPHKRTRESRRQVAGDNFVCKYENCGKTFNAKVFLVRHELLHNIAFRCTYPGCKGFSSEEHAKVAKHVRQFHMAPDLLKEQAQQGISSPSSYVEEVAQNGKELSQKS